MNWLKKDCETYREMISALLDDELSVRDKARLHSPLAQCDDCSALCVAFAAADGALGQKMEDVPESLHRRIMTNMQEHARGQRTLRFRQYLKPTMITAACLAVVAAAVFTMQPMFTMGRSGGSSGNTSGAAPAAASGDTSNTMNGGASDAIAGGMNETMDIAADGLESPELAVPPAGATEAKSTDTAGGADTAPYQAAQGAREGFGPAEAPVGQDVEPTPAPENGKVLMTLELEISAVEETDDDSFTAVVLNDSSGLLSPGIRVKVQNPVAFSAEEADAEEESENGAETDMETRNDAGTFPPALQPGDRVLVQYNSLSVIPEGWLVAADSVERID